MRDPSNPYGDEKRETRDPVERDAETFAVLQDALKRAYNLTFYQRHWDAHGFHPDQVKTLQDFTERCPVITKKMLVADQAEFPSFGSYLGIAPQDIFRIHGSSGTSGTRRSTAWPSRTGSRARRSSGSRPGLGAGFRPINAGR